MSLVHGTGLERVPPDWPSLSLGDVTPVLAAHGLSARAVTWRSPRPLSAAALVDVGDRAVFVKRHAPVVRPLTALREEARFADHVRERGVPVPPAFPAVEHSGWTWEVQERGAGDDAYRDVPSWQPFRTVADARAAGAALAELSLAAADLDAPARDPALLVAGWQVVRAPDLPAALAAHVADRPLLAAALSGRFWLRDAEQVLGPLHARLRAYADDLVPGWTHGDGHPSNLLWAGGQVSAVLDLGLAERTTPVFDLATAIERSTVSWLDREPVARLDLVDALVTGWTSVRPFSRVEAAALPALLPLVHVDFALSEVAYYGGVTRSAANADLAYEGYLLGHARWFGTAQGRRLLAALTPADRAWS